MKWPCAAYPKVPSLRRQLGRVPLRSRAQSKRLAHPLTPCAAPKWDHYQERIYAASSSV